MKISAQFIEKLRKWKREDKATLDPVERALGLTQRLERQIQGILEGEDSSSPGIRRKSAGSLEPRAIALQRWQGDPDRLRIHLDRIVAIEGDWAILDWGAKLNLVSGVLTWRGSIK